MDSQGRLGLVAGATKLTIDAPPIPLPSDSNDAWKLDVADEQRLGRHTRVTRVKTGNTDPVRHDRNLLAAVQAARRGLPARGSHGVRPDKDFARISLPASDADVLREVFLAERPTTVLEIGLAYGSSALAIAEALVASGVDTPHHLIIDAYQDQFGRVGWEAIRAAGLGQICTLIEERSQLALPRLVGEGCAADAAFVDGSHHFHNVFVDLFYLSELVVPGGLVVLDDCDWPSVATAARYFELNAGWRIEPLAKVTRLRAFRLPDPKLSPDFTDFKQFGTPAPER